MDLPIPSRIYETSKLSLPHHLNSFKCLSQLWSLPCSVRLSKVQIYCMSGEAPGTCIRITSPNLGKLRPMSNDKHLSEGGFKH